MILQILPNTRAISHHFDAVVLKVISRANTRQHQNFGRVDGRGRNDNFPVCGDHLSARKGNARRAAILNDDLFNQAIHEVAVVVL